MLRIEDKPARPAMRSMQSSERMKYAVREAVYPSLAWLACSAALLTLSASMSKTSLEVLR